MTNQSSARHFLTGEELTPDELLRLLDRGEELKATRGGSSRSTLAGKTVALVFEKPSTRTRVSFEVGVNELGGNALVLREGDLQLVRGELLKDTALVMSRYVHALVVRTGPQAVVEELAEHATIPVINGLTATHHPCQALADLLTLKQRFGRLEGLRLAYVGDGNNVATSLMLLGAMAGLHVTVASPEPLAPDPGIVERAKTIGGDGVEAIVDPSIAVAGADAIYTDVWASMGDESEAGRRRDLLGPYQVNAGLVSQAHERAIVMHCLPAHPGEEITADVLYGDRSVVWDQAENRLHVQKALLELLFGN